MLTHDTKSTTGRCLRPPCQRRPAAVPKAFAFQRRYGVPFYLGEFSAVRWAPHDAALRYLGDVIDLCEANGWSWSYHAFREFHGWSAEHGDSLDWVQGMPVPPPAPGLTDRARLLLKALARNASPRQDIPAVEAAHAPAAPVSRP